MDKDGSILVRKLKRLVRDALSSSLNDNDWSFSRFCRVAFCVESSCWITIMSDFMASSDTTAVVVSDTLVDSMFVVVVVIDAVVEMAEVAAEVVVFLDVEDSDMEVVDVSIDVEDD